MSGELIPGCYESKLSRLEDELQKAQAELQEARRLLKSVTRGCVCMSIEVPLMRNICAFLAMGVDDAD